MNGKTGEKIEEIILRHSGRGMHILKNYLCGNYCERAAEKLLSLPTGPVLLTTGFYVDGHAETDGPPGTMVLAKALQKLGYRPVIVTDGYCRDFFEAVGLEVRYVDARASREDYREILQETRPVALISIERCGRNIRNDYENMRGISIHAQTARTDLMFEEARREGIPTFGIGDGGNEIGMGNLKEVISRELSLVPCEVEVDYLIIATVSNWGAYALAAYLQRLTHQKVLTTYEAIEEYLKTIVGLGSIDGVTKDASPSVDGFPPEIEKEILDALWKAA